MIFFLTPSRRRLSSEQKAGIMHFHMEPACQSPHGPALAATLLVVGGQVEGGDGERVGDFYWKL